jgi:ABC-2 type transport system ATP-binding protein
MSIEVTQVSKSYGDRKAVDNISFAVGSGQIVGFLGPNGAGKSTTMKIITGYISPDAGTARVAGINVSDDPVASKKKLGYLPESNPLYMDLYVREYLKFVADVHNVANRNQRIEEVIDLVGLTPESSKKAAQLSKGYKQRLGLAAALIHDPEVLILDEPTTGLDPIQILEIREVIRNLGRKKTVLFSSHILQEVEAICDRVIIINRGNVVADSSIRDLQLLHNTKELRVMFNEAVPDGLFASLRDVISMRMIGPNEVQLQTTSPEAARKQILELSLQHNLNIVSLQTGEQRLEEIFRTLTTVSNEENQPK